MPDTEAPVMETLTAHDRCDRCGAQAIVLTELSDAGVNGLRLYWCAHHYNANEFTTLAAWRVVIDDRKAVV